VRPPAGSPSIVIVLMNDMGWDDVGCYGLEIATANIDALAAAFYRPRANGSVSPTYWPRCRHQRSEIDSLGRALASRADAVGSFSGPSAIALSCVSTAMKMNANALARRLKMRNSRAGSTATLVARGWTRLRVPVMIAVASGPVIADASRGVPEPDARDTSRTS